MRVRPVKSLDETFERFSFHKSCSSLVLLVAILVFTWKELSWRKLEGKETQRDNKRNKETQRQSETDFSDIVLALEFR